MSKHTQEDLDRLVKRKQKNDDAMARSLSRDCGVKGQLGDMLEDILAEVAQEELGKEPR